MKAVAELLSDLIRIPSNSAVSNRSVVDYASDVLRGIGWSSREIPYRDPAGVEKVNLIAAPPGRDVARREVDLVLMCHTDTVPFAAEWTRALDPFVVDGYLHGCGACDVKGHLACILAAVSAAGPVAEGLRIVLSADEEIGCVGAGHLIAGDALRPRRMIIGEPTSLHPARAGKGYCLAEVTVTGKEAHSAHPAQGVSAIANAAQLIVAIERVAGQVARETHSFFDPAYTTVNIGTIQGGTARNIVPGVCRFTLEWRPVPGQNPDRMLEIVTELVTQWRDTDPTFRAEVHPLRRQPGFETSANAELVRRVEALTGKEAVSIPFGSEASLFAAIAEEVIVWGPGDMRTAHSSRECVPLKELDEAVACLGELIRAV